MQPFTQSWGNSSNKHKPVAYSNSSAIPMRDALPTQTALQECTESHVPNARHAIAEIWCLLDDYVCLVLLN